MKCKEGLAINAKVVQWDIGGMRPAEETGNMVARFYIQICLTPGKRRYTWRSRTRLKFGKVTMPTVLIKMILCILRTVPARVPRGCELRVTVLLEFARNREGKQTIL